MARPYDGRLGDFQGGEARNLRRVIFKEKTADAQDERIPS